MELREGYLAGRISPVEVVDAVAERMDAVQPVVNAFVTPAVEEARAEAVAAERAYREGRARPLEGIPVAVKDVFDTVGLRTTYGSAIFSQHIPARDAELVRRLRDAGAIVVGKTGTNEFAWGITGENAHYGPVRNPWDPDRVSGGSSGGSAAAVATGVVPVALGSDTGGSIRIPAAWCGVVGLKPTYGFLPVDGLWPLAPSFDHAGVIAGSPADAGLALGLDVQADVAGVRVGGESAALLGVLGATVVDAELPERERTHDVARTMQLVEGRSSHEQAGLWPVRAAEYSEVVRSRLELAESVTLEAYVEEVSERARLSALVTQLFQRVDVVVTPVASIPAPRLGEDASLRDVVMPFTVPQNLFGLPACAVRAGFEDGLPTGVQITGRAGAEDVVLNAAQALWEATPELQERAPIAATLGSAPP